MATIKPRRGTGVPSGISQYELAVDPTNKRVYLGNVGGTGDVVASHISDYVVSVNGLTGAITNIARTNQGNTFSVQQILTAGLSASASDTTLEITATSLNGIGMVVSRSSNPADSGARVGRIQLSRSATSTHNTIIENSSGTLNIYNGSTVGTRIASISTSGGVFDVPITGVTFQPTNGIIRIQLGAFIGGDSPIIRIVGTDVSSNHWNSDIRANASAAANTTHTLPAVTGTLLNTTSSYVSGICGATGAITLSAGSNMTISKSGNTFTFASGGLSWTAVTADQTMAVDTGYLANKSSGTLTLTLPTTSAVGKTLRVSGMQNTWRIAQNASQKIHFGKTTTTTGVGGYLENSNAKDAVELVCAVADLEWNVISSIGNITIV